MEPHHLKLPFNGTDDAPEQQHRRYRQADDESRPDAARSHGRDNPVRTGEDVARRKSYHPIREERNEGNGRRVPESSQNPDGKHLQTVRKLVGRRQNQHQQRQPPQPPEAHIKNRQQLGITKYGTTVAQNPLELRQWLQHSYEEKLDDAVYMKRAIQELDKIIDAGVASAINVEQIMAQVTASLGSKLSQLSNLGIDSIIPKR